jgi:hypothetical protein
LNCAKYGFISIIKAKLKILKLPLISLSLLIILSSCLPGRLGVPTETIDQKNQVGTIVAMTMRFHSTRTQIASSSTPANTASTATVIKISTRIPPNIPVLSDYDYTCEPTSGGGNMTMNLAWTDRSTSEDGYKVYRDGEVIATLAPNSTSYVDIAYVATGKTLSYSVEAFNKDWQLGTNTITYACQSNG